MAINLEAIRKRMAELNGQKKTSSVQLWKPTPGEYKIRAVPWKNSTDDLPFLERWFYYIGNAQGILSPKQFGKPDPIDDLIRKLYSSGKPEDRAMAKQLHPKMRAYVAVVVRGQEDKGVQVWSIGKGIYNRLLGFFSDEEVGDFLDPLAGYDLKVTITQTPGKQYPDTTVDAARKPSKLMEDPAQIEKLLASTPNLDDMYRQKSKEEIEKVLNDWLNSDIAASEDGTEKGAPANDALDALVNEVATAAKAQPASSAPAEEPKKQSKKKVVASDDDDDAPKKKQTLDDAFNELMETLRG